MIKMVTLRLLAVFAASLHVQALLQSPPRNTIFGDERLKGGAFENIDAFSDVIQYNDDSNPYRLPNDTLPIHYNLFWNINISNLSYSGVVEIDLVATRSGVNEIVLHSSHTELYSVALTFKDNNNTIPITYSLNNTSLNFLRLRPNVNLEYNENNPIVYTLTISFGAEMRTEMNGIYRSWFKTNANDTDDDIRWMATTHFQATGARFAFPCYDEPNFKATFNVIIRRPITHGSWFCTRKKETIPATNGYEDDIFYITPVMSTYLLAMIVAEYSSKKVEENEILKYEVIARSSVIDSGQGDYALQVGQKLLAKMSEYTDLDFYSVHPYIKMTQAAIPDFSAGAMENWGLLVYKEANLMYDKQHTNGHYKQVIAYILSHEIAHMWFGNLVTNDWWGMLWLNEGFARYYQYFLTHWVEDYMGLDTRFINEQVHTSLLADSANAHALTTHGLGSPVEVRTMFTTITYNKGASVIRMTEHLLGEEVHKLGLRNYLKNKSFQAALPIDLFNELEAVGISQNALSQYGQDFSLVEYFKSWSDQPGHPVLNIQVNHQIGNMIITQRRFNINTGYAANNFNYIIPITFSTASNPDFYDTKPSHVLRDTVTVVDRRSIGDEWVIFNKQQIGFYRVNYDEHTWNLITLALRGTDRTKIHEFNRAQIVDDVFQFARSGLMTYTRAFNILSFLENETSYAPWAAAITGFSWIRNRLAGTNQLAQLDAMIARWASTVMHDLGYIESPNEDFMRSYLRYQLAPLMCEINVENCRNSADVQFRELVDNSIEVPADSRNWVYCDGLRQGNATDFDFLWERFQYHHVYNEKVLLLQTLGCTLDPASLNIFMSNIVEENNIIRPQDYTTAWATAVTSNEANTQIAFDFVRNNLDTVIRAFNEAATPLSFISSRLRSEADIIAFQGWATENQAQLGAEFNAVFNAAELSRDSIRWAASISPDINDYLVNGNEDFTTTTSTSLAPIAVTTTQIPPLPEIINPTLPNSAPISIISLNLFIIAIIANIIHSE